MLAQRHAQRGSIEQSSEVLFQTLTQLFSYPASTSAVSCVCSFLFLPSIMPVTQCSVNGCGEWSNRWGEKSYSLPSADIFTLQVASTVDTSINNRICQPCWKRHKDHRMLLDGAHVSTPSPPHPHSTRSSLQPSALFHLPLPHFRLLPPLPLCPLLLYLRQPASSLPLVATRSSAAVHNTSNTRPAAVPQQYNSSPKLVHPQSHNSPTLVKQ